MVGYILADNLGLSVGDNVVLAGTLANSVVELIITGILRTDSPSDEELIVSLSIGRTITGKAAGYVSFLRVLIDTDIISKEILSNYLTQEFLVPIALTTEDSELVSSLGETPIIAYTLYGQRVKTQYIETGNVTFFYLRFGTYEFIATPPNARQSEVLRVFVNQFFYTPFELSIGDAFRDFQVRVQNNQQPIFNASVVLSERFGCQCMYSSQTNESGIASFSQIPQKDYNLTVYYGNLSYHSLYRVTQSTLISINLDSSLSLIVKNYSTNMDINGGELTISFINNTEVYHNDNYESNSEIYLYPGTYLFNFSYERFYRNFLLIIDGKVNYTIVLGSDILQVWVRDNEGNGVPANVSVSASNVNTTSKLTDGNGTITFTLDVNLNYTLSIVLQSNQSKAQNREIYFTNASSMVINFFDTYILDIHVVNGTHEFSPTNGLGSCYVEVRNNSVILASGVTNSTGDLRFILTDAGNYTIYAFKGDFAWNNFVLLYNQTTKYNISLGNVRLIIFAKSVSEYPITGIGVSTFRSSEFLQTEITNSSGLLEMIVPIGNYSFLFTTVGYMSSLEVNLTYSQIFWINKTIESCGNLTINLENQLYQSLDGAFVFLRNDYYNYEIKVFTDNSGKISLHGVPWGTYSIQVTYEDYIAPKQIIELTTDKIEVTIQVDTEGPLINAGSYTFWQDRSFSVVWSSEYISGFLESTLSLITTTLTTLVIIVSVLSLLSITSVISHPIVSNERTIQTFQYLGADRQQVTINVVLHLVLLGLLASIIGAVLGMLGMTVIPQFQHINIGGVIIRPRVDFWLLLAILVSNVSVIAIKAGQKVNELYSRHLPGKRSG
jgi:hypothetical protein